jgi:hypothetical protein
VVCSNNGTGVFLFSREGVTQGDPLSMYAYGMGILLLIRVLKQEFPEVKQPWYMQTMQVQEVSMMPYGNYLLLAGYWT